MLDFPSPGAARLYFANSSSSGYERLEVAERGFSLRYTDPAAMLAWCEAAAVDIPPTVPVAEAGLLLAHLGNAHRVCCNFRDSERFLRKALATAPFEPLILEFYASLLKDRRKLRKASSVLSRAAVLRRGLGQELALAATLLESALVLDESGFPAKAVDGALGALEIIGLLPESAERDRLARAGFQNLATYLVNAGSAKDALWVVRCCKEKLMLGGEVYCLRLDWLMADISGAFGEIDHAVSSYAEVRRRFAELGLSQEVAIVTLDLARLLLKPRPLPPRREALSVAPILDSLGIPPDARERKLLAEVVEKGSEVALAELAAALRSNALARRGTGAGSSLIVPG